MLRILGGQDYLRVLLIEIFLEAVPGCIAEVIDEALKNGFKDVSDVGYGLSDFVEFIIRLYI